MTAICDFSRRVWRQIPINFVKFIKFLGDDFMVISDGTSGLFLIATETLELRPALIPIQGAIEDIRFVDTFGGSQLIVQLASALHAFQFTVNDSNKQIHFSIILSVNWELELKQAALLNDRLLMQTENQLQILAGNRVISCFDSSQFIIVAGEFICIFNETKRSWSLIWENREFLLEVEAFHGVYSQLAGFVALSLPSSSFSLTNEPPSSSFLLSKLYHLTGQMRLLDTIQSTPLHGICLEYLILECADEPELLRAMDDYFAESRDFARALIHVARKVELHDASRMFAHFYACSPLKIVQRSDVEDGIKFLPYLAKSYFEDFESRKEAISLILSRFLPTLKTSSDYQRRLAEIVSFLGAFADVKQVLQESIDAELKRLSNDPTRRQLLQEFKID